MRMLALDMDGTLLGLDGQVSRRNLAALEAAERAGVEVVIATGRRHSYAMRVLRGLGLNEENALISSNGAVTRTLGAKLLERTLLPGPTAEWLCGHLGEYRRSLLLTFDRVMPDGDDARGALVVEEMEELNGSIARWMAANAQYIEKVVPIERAIESGGLIQMMLTGPVEKMRQAEARLLESPKVSAVGLTPLRKDEVRDEQRAEETTERMQAVPQAAENAEAALHRTEYPERDLSIVDILPAGCSKGLALLQLAADRGVKPEEIVAVGDNWNDISMLEAAGHAVLMANAPEDLKSIAEGRGWMIGRRNDQDGVAEVVAMVLDGALRGV
ncbi:HAD-IIB family hydrolase [Edaphobacter bradus]|uniref:HAD-IIB family hydrolase n=1 Tax=Edaphobacter bradus TaxID=2259016 RepID=UPI0021DF5517|nr:HAD family hydrolase [Edaphobacter bradus]